MAPETTNTMRKRILLCAPFYLPGYKAGGPIRSIANLIKYLGSSLDFYIVALDRDWGDERAYEGIAPGMWQEVGNARVLYCPRISPSVLRKAFHEVSPDLIFLGSFWDNSTVFSVLLRRLGAFGDTPIILAPRGEFSPGALAIKPMKKNVYRFLAKLLGLYEGLMWQAMGPGEKQDILQVEPVWKLNPDSIFVARSITEPQVSSAPHPPKEAGAVKLAFISRVNEKKNLLYVLKLLDRIRGETEFNIFGPVAEKDAAYWEKCRELIDHLPKSVQVRYHGSVDPSQVPQVLHEHHFFVLPTTGENYCHAAAESFLSGTPVILSNETPWINLEETHAGFDIPLNDPERWISVLQKCVDMDQPTHNRFLNGAEEYGRRFSVEDSVAQQRAMFETALALQPGELLRA